MCITASGNISLKLFMAPLETIEHGFGKCLSATPTKRSQKMHWLDDHKNHIH